MLLLYTTLFDYKRPLNRPLYMPSKKIRGTNLKKTESKHSLNLD